MAKPIAKFVRKWSSKSEEIVLCCVLLTWVFASHTLQFNEIIDFSYSRWWWWWWFCVCVQWITKDFALCKQALVCLGIVYLTHSHTEMYAANQRETHESQELKNETKTENRKWKKVMILCWPLQHDSETCVPSRRSFFYSSIQWMLLRRWSENDFILFVYVDESVFTVPPLAASSQSFLFLALILPIRCVYARSRDTDLRSFDRKPVFCFLFCLGSIGAQEQNQFRAASIRTCAKSFGKETYLMYACGAVELWSVCVWYILRRWRRWY